MDINKLHFISHQNAEFNHLESVKEALSGGCTWIQLRIKNQPEDQVLELGWKAKELCDLYKARLIINDYPKIAQAVNAYGLHLGLSDMPLPEAREIVGKNMIIGGTANTYEHIIQRVDEGADYIGLGPLRLTSTKVNLSPNLNFEGYRNIFSKLKERQINIPIVAIGGINAEDIPQLLQIGLHGVAVSSGITLAPIKYLIIKRMNDLLHSN